MNDFDLLLMRFLLASLGCCAAGFSVWALSAALRRWLPALAAQRSLWLLGQLTVLATFALLLLPHCERVRLIPPLEAATETVTHYIAPPKPATGAAGAAARVQAADDAAAEPSDQLEGGIALFKPWPGGTGLRTLPRSASRLS